MGCPRERRGHRRRRPLWEHRYNLSGCPLPGPLPGLLERTLLCRIRHHPAHDDREGRSAEGQPGAGVRSDFGVCADKRCGRGSTSVSATVATRVLLQLHSTASSRTHPVVSPSCSISRWRFPDQQHRKPGPIRVHGPPHLQRRGRMPSGGQQPPSLRFVVPASATRKPWPDSCMRILLHG